MFPTGHTAVGVGVVSKNSAVPVAPVVASVVLTFTADAQTILNAASARMLRVSFGVM